MAVGGLMLFRSALVSFTPFRVGLAVAFLGLMTTLGSSHGGFVGNLLGGWIETLLGSTGALLVGLTALLAGGLLSRGASYGALLRRSGHAMRLAHGAGSPLARAPGQSWRSQKRSTIVSSRPRTSRLDRRRARLSDVISGATVRAAHRFCSTRKGRPTSRRRSSTCRARRVRTCCLIAPF